jgi:hypothetical protein
MIRKGFIALILTMILAGCNGQTKQEKKDIEGVPTNPKTDIQVNKEYDEQGNLIRYDSSYSYYYSNIENDTILEDSIMQNFREHFNTRYSFLNEPFFEDFFFEDSLLQYDFYKNDFFSNRFKHNMEYMDRLFWGMDSLKNQFFFRQLPPDDKNMEQKSE